MRFEWDAKKRLENLRKHGFDFADVVIVFENETYTDIDERFDYGEVRYFTLGILHGVVVAISHTEDAQMLRVISFRGADKNEQELYHKAFRN